MLSLMDVHITLGIHVTDTFAWALIAIQLHGTGGRASCRLLVGCGGQSEADGDSLRARAAEAAQGMASTALGTSTSMSQNTRVSSSIIGGLAGISLEIDNYYGVPAYQFWGSQLRCGPSPEELIGPPSTEAVQD